jgi:hypothetical protein
MGRAATRRAHGKSASLDGERRRLDRMLQRLDVHANSPPSLMERISSDQITAAPVSSSPDRGRYGAREFAPPSGGVQRGRLETKPGGSSLPALGGGRQGTGGDRSGNPVRSPSTSVDASDSLISKCMRMSSDTRTFVS